MQVSVERSISCSITDALRASAPNKELLVSPKAGICVIYNPIAARGRAHPRLEEIRKALGDRAEFRPTQGPGHAEEIAFEAVQSGFPVVAAAGGDGTVHEVANGLLRANRPDATFAVFPIGSANDYAHVLKLELPAMLDQNRPKNVRRLDVGLIKSAQGRERYWVNCLGMGFSGAVTIETRKIRWLQGLTLYTLGFIKALFKHYACPPMELALDGKWRNAPTFNLSLGIGTREGNLVVAPHAVPDDGLFDYLHAGALSRFEVLRYLPRLAWGGDLPDDHPAIWKGRCREVQVKSSVPLLIHLDGEFFCTPADSVYEVEIRMLPGFIPVLV
jgi:diacylglycerol kinase family enzyme